MDGCHLTSRCSSRGFTVRLNLFLATSHPGRRSRQAPQRRSRLSDTHKHMPSPISLPPVVPAVLVALVAAALIAKGCIPSWRDKWGWGKGGADIPITLLGHIGIAVAFVLLALGAMAAAYKLEFPFAATLPFVGFAVFLCAGVHDSLQARRKKK